MSANLFYIFQSSAVVSLLPLSFHISLSTAQRNILGDIWVLQIDIVMASPAQ